MMISVSLPILVVFAVLVSAILTWLNARGVGIVVSAGVVLAICVAVAAVQSVALGFVGSTLPAIRTWLVVFILPTCLVLAVSRLELLNTKPWLLLILGPTSFIIGLVVVMTVFNMLFASRHVP